METLAKFVIPVISGLIFGVGGGWHIGLIALFVTAVIVCRDEQRPLI